MASLTGQLESPSRGSGPVDPGPGSGGSPFLSGLAKMATGYIGGMAARDSAAKDDARVAAADARAADTRAASNEIFGAALDWNTAETSRLKRLGVAESQGKVPAGSSEIALESHVAAVRAKYPDQQETIFKALAGSGLDHPLFREQQYNEAAMASQQTAELTERNALYKIGMEIGGGRDGDAFDDVVKLGEIARESSNKAVAAKKKLEATIAERKENREDWKFNHEQDSMSLARENLSVVTTLTRPILNNMLALYSRAGSADKAVVAAMTTDIHTTYALARTRGLASMNESGATPESIKHYTDTLDKLEKDDTDFITKDLDSNIQSLQMMETTLKIDKHKLLPLRSKLVELNGAAWVNEVFNNSTNNPITEEMAKALREEWSRSSMSTEQQISTTAYLMGEVIKGKSPISSVPPEKQGVVMQGVRVQAVAQARGIAIGEINDPTSLNTALSNINVTAMRVPKNSPDFRTYVNAMDAVTGTLRSNGLSQYSGAYAKFTDELRDNIQGGRVAVMALTDSIRTGAPSTGTHMIGLSPDGTKYIAVRNPKYVNTVVPGSMSEALGSSLIKAQPDTDTIARVQALNDGLNYLIVTAKYDKEIPNGWTPKSLRSHYTRRTPVTTATGKVIEAPVFGDVVRDVANDIKQLPLDMATAKFGSNDTVSFKSPEDAIVRTALGEASGQGEQGLAAVMAVIRNRVAGSKMSPEEVVLARKQFEPWSNPETSQRLMDIPEDSPKYQQALAILKGLQEGRISDPTNGATHFYNPELNAELAKKDKRKAIPDWTVGRQGQRIGDHVFYNVGYKG